MDQHQTCPLTRKQQGMCQIQAAVLSAQGHWRQAWKLLVVAMARILHAGVQCCSTQSAEQPASSSKAV
jgi:hypothetical protein